MSADRDLFRLNPVIATIQPSATIAVTSRARELREKGVDVIELGAGEPDFDTPAHIVRAAIQAIRAGDTRYTPPDGTPALKATIRDKLARENGVEYTLDEIAACCGGKHAIHNFFAVTCSPGDEILIPAPYWVSYPHQARIAGAVPVILPTRAADGYRLRPEALAEAVTPRTRVFVLNSPCNPTGVTYSLSELEAFVQVAIEHDLLILSDEVYEHLIYGDTVQVSPASLGPEAKAHVVIANSVSKTYAMTGWRVGFLAGPRPIIAAVARLQSHQSQNPASPSQAAAIAAYRGGLGPTIEMRQAFERRARLAVERLRRIPGLTVVPPEGAFYAFPDASELIDRLPPSAGIGDGTDLCTHLIEEAKVACVPGEAFGSPTAFRISFATSTENLRAGLDRIEAAVHALLAS